METLLRSQEDLDKFGELTNGLHDAAVREVALVWRGRVTNDGSMHGYGAPMDGRIVLHSQNDLSPLIEIDCKGVTRFAIHAGLDLELDGEFSKEHVRLFLCGRDARRDCLVEAASVSYRIASLGETPEAFLAVKDHPLFLEGE